MDWVKGASLGIISALSLILSLSPSVFASVSPCDDFLASLAEGGSLQSVHRVEWAPGKFAFFSNPQMAMEFKNGPTVQAIRHGTQFLMKRGSLEIPVDENGYIVASSAGSYSEAIWARDTGRMTFALSPSKRGRAVRALLRLMGSPRNRELFFLNLRHKGVHRMSPEELRNFAPINENPHFRNLHRDASMFVPHIRFQKEEIADPRFFDIKKSLEMDFRPQQWNHKQNDALAITFLAAADAMKTGAISWGQLGPDEQAALVLILAYGIHVEYYDKWDAGAWEEVNGRRTSSVAQFTDALIAFEKYMLSSGRRIHLRQNPLIPQDIANQIDELIRPDVVRRAIDKGIEIVKHQVHRGEVPDAFEPSPISPRFSDAALSHLAWTMPEYLDESDYRAVLKHLQSLKRDKGMIRYNGDVYLILGQFWRPETRIPQELLMPQHRQNPPLASDVMKAFWNKDHSSIQSYFGGNFEAQWVLGEIMLLQMLPQMMNRFQDSPYREEYRALLAETAVRFFSMVTGEDAEGRGPVGIDGQRVAPWVIPEAWIPVRLYKEDGRVETLYSPSPYTPLYWAKAEAWLAIDGFFKHCRWDCLAH